MAQTLATSRYPVLAWLAVFGWFGALFILSGAQNFGHALDRRCALCTDAACSAAQPGSEVDDLPCGPPPDARACPAPFVCLPALRPDAAWASFDSTLFASLAVLRLTLSGARARSPRGALSC